MIRKFDPSMYIHKDMLFQSHAATPCQVTWKLGNDCVGQNEKSSQLHRHTALINLESLVDLRDRHHHWVHNRCFQQSLGALWKCRGVESLQTMCLATFWKTWATFQQPYKISYWQHCWRTNLMLSSSQKNKCKTLLIDNLSFKCGAILFNNRLNNKLILVKKTAYLQLSYPS